MTVQVRPDAIDCAAGLTAGSPLFDLRAERADYVNGTQACRAAVLTPANDLGLPTGLRAAIATRVGIASGRPDLLTMDLTVPDDPDLTALAQGGTPTSVLLRAIAHHSDMIARDPAKSSDASLADLGAAGLSTPQIIALSELLAYCCFHIRIAHGLSLLKDPK